MEVTDSVETIEIIIGVAFIPISVIHYRIIKCIYLYKRKESILNYGICGILFSLCNIALGNIFFRIPMFIIYAFDEKENNFACVFTVILSFISSFLLSFFTYYLTAILTNKLNGSELKDDNASFVVSITFYPLYIVIFFWYNVYYFYDIYGQKYFKFYGNPKFSQVSMEFQLIVFTLNIIAVCVCLYNGIICMWFYAKRRAKALFVKCILFPTIFTTIPFFGFMIYKIAMGVANFIITLLMAIIGVGLSFFLRKKIYMQLHKETQTIEVSNEDLDDLVEYIDDRICFENLNNIYNDKKIEVPNSFGGIKFGSKFSKNIDLNL